MNVENKILLTEKVRAAGWAAKLDPGTLDRIIGKLDIKKHPDLIVGIDTSDDAGVYKISPDVALVQTLDFLYQVSL